MWVVPLYSTLIGFFVLKSVKFISGIAFTALVDLLLFGILLKLIYNSTIQSKSMLYLSNAPCVRILSKYVVNKLLHPVCRSGVRHVKSSQATCQDPGINAIH